MPSARVSQYQNPKPCEHPQSSLGFVEKTWYQLRVVVIIIWVLTEADTGAGVVVEPETEIEEHGWTQDNQALLQQCMAGEYIHQAFSRYLDCWHFWSDLLADPDKWKTLACTDMDHASVPNMPAKQPPREPTGCKDSDDDQSLGICVLLRRGLLNVLDHPDNCRACCQCRCQDLWRRVLEDQDVHVTDASACCCDEFWVLLVSFAPG